MYTKILSKKQEITNGNTTINWKASKTYIFLPKGINICKTKEKDMNRFHTTLQTVRKYGEPEIPLYEAKPEENNTNPENSQKN